MNRDLRLITLALAIWGVGEGLFFYLTPLYLQELDADPVEIGVILGIAAIMLTICHIPAGVLSDRYGPKSLMVGSWSMGLVATATMYLAPSLALFVTGLFLYNFAGFMMSPMSTYVSRTRGAWTLARALTTASSGFSAGTILGALAGGWIGEGAGLRAIYGIATLVFVASTALILLIRAQPPIEQAKRPPYDAIGKDVVVRRFLALIFLTNFALWLSWPLTPVYLQGQRSVSLSAIGLLGSFNALGIVVLNLTLGRLHPRKGFLLTQGLVGLSAAALCFGTGLPWYAAGYFLAGGFRTARSLAAALVEGLVQPGVVGLAFGLTETIASSAVVLANPLAGLLYSVLPTLPYYAGLILSGTILMVNAIGLPRSAGEAAASRFMAGSAGVESEGNHGVLD